jgi:hypothetical protein
VWGEQAPEAGFEAVAPDLEDVYFATIKGLVDNRGAASVN